MLSSFCQRDQPTTPAVSRPQTCVGLAALENWEIFWEDVVTICLFLLLIPHPENSDCVGLWWGQQILKAARFEDH